LNFLIVFSPCFNLRDAFAGGEKINAGVHKLAINYAEVLWSGLVLLGLCELV